MRHGGTNHMKHTAVLMEEYTGLLVHPYIHKIFNG